MACRNTRAAARLASLVLVPVVLLGGCTVGPDYEEPEIAMPDEWESAVAEELSRPEQPLVSWWEALEDTTLDNLLRRAEFQSLDLAAAVTRVQEARALRGIATGDNLPDIILSGFYSRTQISENSAAGKIISAAGGDISPGNVFNTQFDFSWEIDVFGRIRRNVEASTAVLQASIEDYRDVLVTLYAEVAATYIDVRSLQARAAFARANASAQEETLGLTQNRFDAGLTSALDVARAESNLATTRAAIPALESRLVAAKNRLSVLLGEQPGTIDTAVDSTAAIPTPPSDITTGIPADLLRRRPDVRRSERELAAQTARIGVATAELYPRFRLDGFIGLESINGSEFVDGGSFFWGIVPFFSWNIFRGGKIRKQIQVEEARTEQALLFYEQSILFALEETENALVAYWRERERADRLREAVDALDRSVELVHTQYMSGLTDFQSYLDAQRSLFFQQDDLAQSEGQVVINLIAVNKALGGGWTVETTEAPDQASGETGTPDEETRNDE